MHVYRNIEARSCNHCCSGKAWSITYSECVFVALGAQHAHYYTVICRLSGCTILLQTVSQTARFLEKRKIGFDT